MSVDPWSTWYRNRFEQFEIQFSSGESRTINLGAESGKWNIIYFNPPISTEWVNMTATEYSTDTADIVNYLPYGIREISIDGPEGNYGYIFVIYSSETLLII